MAFDFCIDRKPDLGAGMGLNTIFRIWGDESYQIPRKEITEGKTYFVYTTEGMGEIHYDGRCFQVEKGQYLFMRPQREFRYGCPRERWDFWWFEFLRPQCHFVPDRVETAPVNDFQLSLWEQGLIYAKQNRWDVTEALFMASCRMLDQAQKQRRAPAKKSQLANAEDYIRGNLESVTVTSLCEHMGLHERTLRNLFYGAYGCSPKQRITKLRLEMAGELLSSTTLRIHEIASGLGFSSQFHFSRSFREHYGMPPLEYRRLSIGE